MPRGHACKAQSSGWCCYTPTHAVCAVWSQIMDAIYEKDPNGATLAFADMMKKQIVMPAHMMDDGEHKGKTGRNLFAVSTNCKQCTSCNSPAIMSCLVQCMRSLHSKCIQAAAALVASLLPVRCRFVASFLQGPCCAAWCKFLQCLWRCYVHAGFLFCC